MRPTSPSFAAALRKSHRSTARVTVLDPTTFDVVTVLSGETGYAISGTVSMDAGRAIRRTCDLAIANPGGAFTPTGPGSLLFFGSLVRLERGLYLDATTIEWFTLGHFVVGRPMADVMAGESRLAIAGEDRTKALVRSRFTAPTTYTTGTRIATVVQTEAAAAGMGATRYRLDDGGKTLTKDRTFDEDVSRIDALSELVRDYGLEMFADADGYLALAEPPDPITAPLAWTYERGEGAIHTDLSRQWTDDRLYNHVLVTGESSDPAIPPVRAEVMDTNPASPTYVGGPLGDRLYRYTSAMITSTAQANEVAVNLLADVALIVETVDVGGVVNPALEPGDAIAVTDPDAKVAGRYLVDTITVPLGQGPQSIGARNTRSIGGLVSSLRSRRRRWWPHERKAAA